jgi:hypothetical protein
MATCHAIIEATDQIRGVIPMFKAAIRLQKTKKYVIQGFIFFTLFMFIYTIIDTLNMSYVEMNESFGIYLVVVNITTNVLMAMLSTLLMNLSTAMVELKGKEGKGSTLGFLSILFGILTYGCTGCVIAFFASVGIAFSVIALPLAGYPYKLIALLMIGVGLYVIYRELEYGKCKVKL